jgi:hypothetical protein
LESHEDLLRAFSELEEAIVPTRGALPLPPRAKLRRIAKLNLEIGRTAAVSADAATRMRRLQRLVNDVTVAVKAGRDADARSALSTARTVLQGFLESR